MRTSFLPLLSDLFGGVCTSPEIYWEDYEETPLKEEFSVTMPGYETVEVSLQPKTRSLIVIGKDKKGEEVNKRSYFFSRIDWDLLDQDRIEAEYRRGILTVKTPKKEEEKKKMEDRVIKVKLLE